MKTQTDPKVDYAFKHVFGREESKPALQSLVGAIFQAAGEPGIASLELLNPFNAKSAENAKLWSLNSKELLWAIGDLFMISRTDPERELYEARLQARRDAAAQQQFARDEGLREGRAEGLRLAIRSLEESLGRGTTPLEELQSLSWEELQEAWSRLQADLRRPGG